MTDLARLPLTADGADDTRPQGVCDDCARIVRPCHRGVEVDMPMDAEPADVVRAMIHAAAALLSMRRCATCGMVRP